MEFQNILKDTLENDLHTEFSNFCMVLRIVKMAALPVKPCKSDHLGLKRALKIFKQFLGKMWDDDLICITLFVKIFYIQGYWPTLETNHLPGYLLRYTNPRGMLLWALYLAIVSSPIAAYQSEGKELMDTLEPIALIFIAFMVAFYVISFAFLGGRFKDMIEALDLMRQRGSLHPEQPSSIWKQTKILSMLTMGYYGLCVFLSVVITIIMTPLLFIHRKFYTSCWFPYDSDASPYFEITLLGWLVSVMSAACLMGLVQAFLLANLVQAIGQFQLLNYNIKAMHPAEKTQVVQSQENDDQKNVQRIEEKSSQKRRPIVVKDDKKIGAHRSYGRLVKEKLTIQRRLKQAAKKKFGGFFQSTDVHMKVMVDRCARHHQSILSYIGCINSAFNLILIQQYSCSMFPSLIAIILVMHTPEMSMKIFIMVVLVVICNFTLGLYSFLACKITEESEFIRDSVFGCDWLTASDNFKRSMRLMISRSNQPALVRVGGCMTVSMESLWSVLKLLYTYTMAARTIIKRIGRE